MDGGQHETRTGHLLAGRPLSLCSCHSFLHGVLTSASPVSSTSSSPLVTCFSGGWSGGTLRMWKGLQTNACHPHALHTCLSPLPSAYIFAFFTFLPAFPSHLFSCLLYIFTCMAWQFWWWTCSHAHCAAGSHTSWRVSVFSSLSNHILLSHFVGGSSPVSSSLLPLSCLLSQEEKEHIVRLKNHSFS